MISILIGIMLAELTILGFQFQSLGFRKFAYTIALVLAAIIYVGFSISSREIAWVLIETAGVILFVAIAIAGLKRSTWFLIAGWTLHPVWDVMLHTVHQTPFVPTWYPLACLGYDLAIATYLAFNHQEWNATSTPDNE